MRVSSCRNGADEGLTSAFACAFDTAPVGLLARRRDQLLALSALVASGIGLGSVHAHYPIQNWLLVRELQYWGMSVYFSAGCLSAGLEILHRVAPGKYRATEAPFIAFPLGLLAFGFSVFLVGLAGGIGRVFFAVAPGVFFAAGFVSLRRTVQRLEGVWARSTWRPSYVEMGALAVLAAGIVAVYIPILTPKNLQHDARWYHLPIAAQYVAQGGIGKFDEGWFLGAYPHLSSLIYTWAFSWPAGIVHRVELCAHLEFVVFLVTIAATPAVIRRLLPGKRLPVAAAAFFLFPGFLVYDSNLSVGADHIAAVFAPGALLVLIPALRTLGTRHVVLVGAMAAGAAMTKYSALCLVIPLLGAVVVRAFLHATQRSKHGTTRGTSRYVPRSRFWRAGQAVGVLALTFVVLWSPHWLKNTIYYGDPLYPTLYKYLHTLKPWDHEAQFYFEVFKKRALLTPTAGFAGVLESLWAASTLGLSVHEYGFHGEVPTFGFLFAVTLYLAPIVSVRWRVWVVYALGWSAAVVWFYTNHRDRYLQACLPWLVAATLAVLVVAWDERERAGRFMAAILVAAQLACGAGLSLLPAHNMANGGTALPDVIALVGAGYQGKYRERFWPDETWSFAAWTDMGRVIPRGSRVLVHEDRLWIGLDRAVVVDEAGWQAGIRYADLKTPASVWQKLREHGVTHLVTGRAHADGGGHGITGDLVFWDFVSTYAERLRDSGRLTAWAMPRSPPPDRTLGTVAILTCNQSQPLGVYAFERIRSRVPLRAVLPTREDVDRAIKDADYVVNELECDLLPTIDEKTLPDFRFMGSHLNVGFWKRRTPQ
jgi:hypothetical protein